MLSQKQKQTTCRTIRSIVESRRQQVRILQTATRRLYMRDMVRNGVAIIVETLTDNKNRTAGNVRNAFTKGNGSIGTQGCVSFMFDQKGQIIIDKEELEDECGEMDADELMMTALDAGAEDFNEEEDSFEIITAPDDFSAVREALEKAGIPLVEAQIAMIPQTYVELTDDQAIKDLHRTLDLLDDDDDVTDVWTNWDE